jgi:hypothetical protein
VLLCCHKRRERLHTCHNDRFAGELGGLLETVLWRELRSREGLFLNELLWIEVRGSHERGGEVRKGGRGEEARFALSFALRPR